MGLIVGVIFICQHNYYIIAKKILFSVHHIQYYHQVAAAMKKRI